MTQLLNEIDNLLENHNADIDEIIDKIGDIYTIGHEVNTRKEKKTKNRPKITKKKWYDKTCQENVR